MVVRHMGPLFLEGMQGLGDNLHQRALIRGMMTREHELILQTPWPWVYHDLVGPRLKLARSNSRLRKQAQNEAQQGGEFLASVPAISRRQKVWYRPDDVRRSGSVLAAMLASCGVVASPATTDFSLPLLPAWRDKTVDAVLAKAAGRPILIVRPLVERKEWGGCAARNPDLKAYAALFAAIRRDFFVISLADFVPGVEWQVGEPLPADIYLHHGEINGGALAVLFAAARLVFASPGFAVILAQAVGTPAVCTFGGYENAASFSLGARLAPTLSIEPIRPCQCFAHVHNCDKRIDLPLAITRLLEFSDAVLAKNSAIGAGYPPDRVGKFAEAVSQ